jgi:hypothetical protein
VTAAGGLGGHDAEAGRLEPGLEKTRLKKKQPAQWVFLGFLWFVFYIFAQKKEFLGFTQFQEYF